MTSHLCSRISPRPLALAILLAAAAALLALMVARHASAESPLVEVNVAGEDEALTTLTVEGVASRSVSYDGAVAHFRVVVERTSALEARQEGSRVVSAIGNVIDEQCTPGEPDSADHTAPPTCISPNGLEYVGFRLTPRWDWLESGRVLRGWEYEYSLKIAIRGTGFAGGLVDLVVVAGSDSLHFDSLDFTASGRAEAERLVVLDAIDDGQAQADAIAAHMGYRIVRIVELNPIGSVTAARSVESAEFALAADESFEPTPVFGGSETVTKRVRMVYELAPAPSDTD